MSVTNARRERGSAKLLHVIDTGGPGGAETVFAGLADGLRSYGYDAVAAIGRDDWLAARLRHSGIEPTIAPATGGRLAYLNTLRQLIRTHRPTAVIAHLLGASLYASLAAALSGVPAITVFHGQKDLDQSRGNRLKGRILSLPRGRSVFVSAALRDDVRPRLRLGVERCTVIANGIDIRRFQGHRSRLRATSALPDDSLLVGAVGNIRQPKAYDVLLRAAAIAVRRNPNLHFVVAGDRHPDLFPPLAALHESLGLGEAFRFVGLIDDIPDFLAGLDIFALASHREGFSIACVEAMASGMPVVATRSGGPEGIVVDGETGFLVPPDDPNELAERILKLAGDAALRQRFGEAGRRRAAEEFSRERWLNRYAGLLAALEVD